jgi:hypothetical protein
MPGYLIRPTVGKTVARGDDRIRLTGDSFRTDGYQQHAHIYRIPRVVHLTSEGGARFARALHGENFANAIAHIGVRPGMADGHSEPGAAAESLTC